MSDTTDQKTRFLRREIAAMIGQKTSYVSALCSKTKRTLIPDPENPKIIDLAIAKNANYVRKKMVEIQLNIKPPRAVQRKDQKESPPPPPEKKTKAKKKATAKQKKEAPAAPPPPPPPTAEELVGPAMKALKDKENIMLRKATAEAELKELEVQKKRGDLVSAAEIAPLVTSLSKKRDNICRIETLSLIKEMVVEYELDSTFQGRFERDFIKILNRANEQAVDEFKAKLNG